MSHGQTVMLMSTAIHSWPHFDGWCAAKGVDPLEMSSRRLINLIYFYAIDGLEPAGVAAVNEQLRGASGKNHPWIAQTPSANPSGRWAGKRGPGRTAAQRSGPPPGWVSDEQNIKNMAQFLVGTGNAKVIGTIVKAQKKQSEVTPIV